MTRRPLWRTAWQLLTRLTTELPQDPAVSAPERGPEEPNRRLSKSLFTNIYRSTDELPGVASGKEFACQCRRRRFDPQVRKIPWRRKWQPTPVFLPEKSHEQRSLVGYSPKELQRVG